MELDTNTRRKALQEEIVGFEILRFKQESLGRMWQTIGNAKMAEGCAETGAMAMEAIAHLKEQLEELA